MSQFRAESGLTTKQDKFVQEYLIDLNGKQAAIRAGYNPHSAEVQASKMLSKGKVKEAVALKAQTIADKLGIDAAYVLGSFKKVADRSMEAEPVLDREGNAIGDYVFNANGANKALEMLGKHLRLFGDDDKTKGVNVTINVIDKF